MTAGVSEEWPEWPSQAHTRGQLYCGVHRALGRHVSPETRNDWIKELRACEGRGVTSLPCLFFINDHFPCVLISHFLLLDVWLEIQHNVKGSQEGSSRYSFGSTRRITADQIQTLCIGSGCEIEADVRCVCLAVLFPVIFPGLQVWR